MFAFEKGAALIDGLFFGMFVIAAGFRYACLSLSEESQGWSQ